MISTMPFLRSIPVTDPRRESCYLATLRDYMPPGDAASALAKEISSGRPAAVRTTVEKLSIPAEHKQALLDRLYLK